MTELYISKIGCAVNTSCT